MNTLTFGIILAVIFIPIVCFHAWLVFTSPTIITTGSAIDAVWPIAKKCGITWEQLHEEWNGESEDAFEAVERIRARGLMTL